MRKITLDEGNVLTVHRVVTGHGERRPDPGDSFHDVVTWWFRSGKLSGRIECAVEIHAVDAGSLVLDYRLNGQPVQQTFALVARPCQFGGWRWYARCPQTGRTVSKLYGCAGTFQSRRVIDGSYHSQDRVPMTEKLRDREVWLLRRLGADDSARSDPPKPKWMRWPTYSRLALELRAVRYRYGLAMARDLYRLTGHDVSDGQSPEVVARTGIAMP